jgi:hypothetical protein
LHDTVSVVVLAVPAALAALYMHLIHLIDHHLVPGVDGSAQHFSRQRRRKAIFPGASQYSYYFHGTHLVSLSFQLGSFVHHHFLADFKKALSLGAKKTSGFQPIPR